MSIPSQDDILAFLDRHEHEVADDLELVFEMVLEEIA
jgi:hypothetical protein